MSVNVLVLRGDGPPPGAPPEWDRMPWTAQERWIRRQARGRAVVDQPAPPERTPKLAQAREPAPRRYDEVGRRIWSDFEMRAAAAAYERSRRGRGPELTPDQQDAHRAERRRRNQARRRGKPGRPRRRTPPGAILETVLAVADPEQACEQLGITPWAVSRALGKAGRDDLARPYVELRNRLAREQYAAERGRP